MYLFNTDELEIVLKNYVGNLDEIRPQELYKWQATLQFQKEWNPDAVDFPEMLSRALSASGNLLAGPMWWPHTGLIEIAEFDPDATLRLLVDLFDEDRPLDVRLPSFVEDMSSLVDALNVKKREQGEREHKNCQDARAASVYLAFAHPDSNYLYKPTMATKFAKRIGAGFPSGKFEKPVAFKELMDNVLSYLREKHGELIEQSNALLPEELRSIDPNGHLLAQDIAWFVDGYNEGLADREDPTEGMFSWIPTYLDISRALKDYRYSHQALCSIVKKCIDEDSDHMDPFTFFAMFNGKITKPEKRDNCIKSIVEDFSLDSEVPTDYDGIPVVNPLRWRYWGDPNAIENNWNMFEAMHGYADKHTPETEKLFIDAFDTMRAQVNIGNASLTMGLFWMRPDCFIPFDNKIRDYVKQGFGIEPPRTLTGESYLDWQERIRAKTTTPPEQLSYLAWLEASEDKQDDEWWPLPDEYDPGITTEQWVEHLDDSEIATNDSLIALKCFRAFANGATCTEVAAKYGRSAGYYNVQITEFARRVHQKTGCPMSERDEGGQRRWSLPCLGKQAEKEQAGVFAWKLRPELYEALERIDLSGICQYAQTNEESVMNLNAGSNIILYGPPGTGKTYNVAAMAWLISQGREASLDAVRSLSRDDRAAAKQWYDAQLEDQESGQVAFTTFHQSYGYEEFIEGIRPVVEDDDEGEQAGVRYTYEDGVFKSFCKRASRPVTLEASGDFGFNSDPTVWKVSLEGTGKNQVRTECLENGHIRIGWDEYGSTISDETDFSEHGGKSVLMAFEGKMRKGDIVVSCFSSTTTDAIGVVTGDAEWHDEYDYYRRLRAVRWLVKDIDYDIVGKFELPVMTLSTIYRLKLSKDDILEVLSEVGPQEAPLTMENTKPYVFVIDEINRGNISKVFGELITLIEPSKRLGQPDQQTAILPYTKKPFGIPSNVTIIGTMNTADRSIALMDTALRRRFKFMEMLPDYGVLETIGEVDGINVAAMVRRMNERIAVLYDREHTIGHAYFMPLAEQPTLETLSSIFRNRIFPLLQEYFYDDYEKIRYVLADNQKAERASQFVLLEQTVNTESLFGNADNALYGESKIFVVNEEAFGNTDSYLDIYS